MWTSYTLPFVDLNTDPVEGFDDVFFGTRHKAILIGIFDAQEHLAAHFPGEQVIIEGGAHPANMQRTGWAGRETNTNTNGI